MEFNFESSSSTLLSSDNDNDIINTITSIDFPVYRSIAIETNLYDNNNNNNINLFTHSNHSNILESNMLLLQPSFKKSTTTKSYQNDNFQIEIDLNNNNMMGSDDDLMNFLNDCSNDFNDNEITSLDNLEFDCLAKTSVTINNLQSDEVIAKVNQFIKDNNVTADKKGSSKWVCESFVQLEFIKFQIQIFSSSEGFVVEFLRLRGCSLSFSSLFRKFNSSSEKSTPSFSFNVENNVSELEVIEASPESIISLLKYDIVEGIKIVCSIPLTSTIENMLMKITNILIESKELISIVTFVRYLLNHLSTSNFKSSSGILLQSYDTLIPLLVKESFNQSISSCIRSQCKELVEKRVNLY
mmetsp:Transcript_1675/g.1677  ORF Transcript_1675/g.1677 Transcript_1675/m.1677 type:complete len:355 (-) Transcript_1675:4-1068(-)